ncbi:alpha N-terminal protein methyltransferase 1 [Citrus sinensis]|uniref:Alpha N-terminal protein methyltransferase 1 n=1 Tax=Citrus sinensis TaxID=2711 RepID=A0ACB8NDY3_CITSI|nr:alpha N-terminal protein methyltransferase 1 [Citrus sinensis]
MLDRLRLHAYPKEPLTCAKLTQHASLKLETKRRAKPTLHLLHVGRRKEKLRSAEAGAAADPKHKESSAMEVSGLDSDGKEFKNAEEMWREQIGEDGEQQEKKTQWYREGISYWEGVEASVDGVLGGFGNVNEVDIKGSEAFLQMLLSDRFPNARNNQHLVALDCGSGIGRITKNLLIRYFNEVDLLEPVSHFLDAARESLAPENHMAPDMHKATNFFCVPLQDFTPETGRYDVIWVQWCIGHLTDDDFVSFFKRAKVGLKPGGFFVLKENIARSGTFLLSHSLI